MDRISDEIISKYIGHSCSDEELRLVERWIAESPENARELFATERAALLASSLADDEGSRQRVASDIEARIEAYEKSRRTLRRRRMMFWSAAAVMMGVIVTLAVLFMKPRTEWITVDTYADSRMVTLPDSSHIWLNKYSSVSYPEHFAKDSRQVKLSGEAYFEVTKDPARPFSVTGEYIKVEVLGTKFNFMSDAKRKSTVSLLEGRVEVSADKSRDRIVLSPGQKAVFDPETGRMTVADSKVALDAVWHDRLIPFHNATIREIVSDLEELYGVEIAVSPTVDTEKTYSGATEMYESVDSTLSALCNTLPVSYTRKGAQIVISAK